MDASLLTPEDPRWKDCLSRVRHDFYHRPEYLDISAEFEGGKAGAFLATEGEDFLLIPLLIRALPEHLDAPGLYDAITPYGYPCPLFQIDHSNREIAHKLVDAFSEFCRDSSIISFFARLHPLIGVPDEWLASTGTVIEHGKTVYMDLTPDADQLFSEIRADHRRHIRRATEAGFHANSPGPEGIHDFFQIYSETMKRLNASQFYFFTERYFERLLAELPDHLTVFSLNSPEGDVACSYLLGTCCDIMQGHLIGAVDQYRKVSPMKLCMRLASLWGKDRGLHYYHIGGGVGAKDDALFKFKKGFSDRLATFKTWRSICLPEQYSRLVTKSGHDISVPGEFFPLYRKPIIEPVDTE